MADSRWRKQFEEEYERLLEQAIDGTLPEFKIAVEYQPTPGDNRPPYERYGQKTLSNAEAQAVLSSVMGRKAMHS